MLAAGLKPRGFDAWGSGAYLATRTSADGTVRVHKGFDYALEIDFIFSPCIGTVTKLGYPYGWVHNATNYRYVEIEDLTGLKHRIFYIQPICKKGDTVTVLTPIGYPQDISPRYQDPNLSPITPHIHYEIINPKNGETVNPETHHV